MRTRAELKPVGRGRVIGLGLGRFTFVGGGVALMLAASTAWAGPEGARVAAGKAKFHQRGNKTVIRVSDRAIIDYTGFDIGRGESVRFVQPNSSSRVLNRIHSARPTTIEGSLKANGHVYLLNRQGVIFTGTSMIDVPHLFAAAGRMSNADFLSGTDRFRGIHGDVINQGTIRADSAALIGAHVANSGVVISENLDGAVVMVSGEDVTLTPRGGRISVTIATPANGPSAQVDDDRAGVENTGTVRAPQGRSLMVAGDLYALAIRNSGTVKAKEISLDAGGGRVDVSGRLNAADRTVGGLGGEVRITGPEIAVHGAAIDASGSLGGGSIRIGGDIRGGGTMAHAQTTTVDGASTIRADSARRGDGGSVVVYADGHTAFNGQASARAGKMGGDGGFIETSGKRTLDIAGARVDARGIESGGSAGGNGEWLLDPTDIVIDAAAATAIVSTLEMGTDVTVETGAAGADPGDITVDAAITKAAGGDAALTLNAANDITVNQAITSTAGELDVNLNANSSAGTNVDPDTAAGQVVLNNDGVTTDGRIDANGGTVTIRGVDADLNGGATITGGNVAFRANSSSDQSIGLAGGTGVFTLAVADLGAIGSPGTVSVATDGRDDAATVGALDLSAETYDLSVRAGSVTADAITMAAGNDVTLRADAGPVIINGAVSAVGGTATVRGDNAAIDGAGSSITAGTIRVVANGDRTIGVGGPGDFELTPTEIGNLASTTLEISSASAGDIIVGNSGAPGTPITPLATDVSLVTLGRIEEVAADNLTDITIAGRLTLRSGGGIGDPGTDDGTGPGPLDIAAASLVAEASGVGGVFIKDAGSLTVESATTADGAISIRTAGAMTVTDLSATQTTPTGRTVELVAGGNLTAAALASNGSVHAESTATDADISIAAADIDEGAGITTTLCTVGAGGDAAITNAQGLNFADTTVGGALTATASGAITDASALSVGGAASFKTLSNTGAAITLDSAQNVFGALTARARDAGDTADAAGDIAITERSIPGNTRMDVTVISTAGSVTLTAPDVAIDTAAPGTAVTAGATGAGAITLQPNVPTTSIGVDGAGDFNISLAELQELATAGEVTIGAPDSGPITVGGVADIDLTAQGYTLRLRGGATSFLRSITLAPDSRFALETGAITSTTAGPDVIVPGANGRLRIDGTGAVDLETSVSRLAVRTTAGNIDIANFGGSLQVASLAGVNGVVAPANAAVSINTAGTLTLAAPVAASGTGVVTLTAATGIADNSGAGPAVVAPTVVLETAAGSVAGPGGAGGFKTDTGDLNASAPDGLNIFNTGTTLLRATLNASDGPAVIASGGSIATDGAAWAADSFDITAGGAAPEGVFTASDAITADAGNIRITANDISLTGAGAALDAGTADVVVRRTTDGTIGLGDIISEDTNLTNAELAKITAANLVVGDTAHTTGIVVRDVAAADTQNIGTVRLRAEKDNATIEFAGAGSTFNALDARADAGIEVDSNITADTGDLVLNADADAMADADAPGIMGMRQDQLFIRAGRTLATQPDGGDIVIGGSAGGSGQTAGIVAAGNLTIDANQDVVINSAITVGGTLMLDADGAVTFAGAGEGQVLNITANNGINFGESVTNQSGNLSIDADADDDGAGSFALATGKTLTTSNGDLAIVAADFALDGSIAAGTGDVSITRSTAGEIVVGAFADAAGRMTVTGDELSRIGADNLRIGGGPVTAITVDGVTVEQSDGVAGVTTLDAGTTLTFSGAASTFTGLRGDADGDVTVSSALSTDGPLTLNADVDSNDSGALVLTGNIATGDGDFVGTGTDVSLAGNLNAGTGSVRLARSSAGNITVDNAPDAAGRMVIDDAELARINAGGLTVGGGSTGAITVRNFTEADGAGISGTTTFDAGTVLTFNGASTFKSLRGDADDRIAVNGNLTTTVGDLMLDGNADLADDPDDKIEITSSRVLTAARDLILSSSRGGIEGAGSLTLRAGRAVNLNHSVTTSGDTVIAADTDADGDGLFTVAAGSTLSTSGSNLVVTAADVALTGSLVTGGGAASIDHSAVVGGGGGQVFVGAFDTAVGRLTLSGAELARITATGLTVGGAHTRAMTVSGVTDANTSFIAGGLSLAALADEGAVTFSGAVSRFNALDVKADRTITTSVALTTDSGDLTMDAGANTPGRNDGVIALGANLTAAAGAASHFDVTLNSPVRLRTNVLIEGEDVTFASRINSASSTLRSLAVNSFENGTTTFRGAVGGDNRLASITTNADGGTRIGADLRTTRSGMAFNDRVTLTSDVTLDDAGAGILFNNSVNSASSAEPRSLTVLSRRSTSSTVNSVPLIAFNGDVGATAPLREININFDPSQGINGRSEVPRVATIVVRRLGSTGQFVPVTGPLPTFRFIAEDGFRMGQNEKMTVGGNLEIRADSVRLGDVVTLGDMRVVSPDIRLLTRAPGDLSARNPGSLTGTGVRRNDRDRGLDFVAGGDFIFSSTPVAVGDGPSPQFGSASGRRDSANRLGGFIFQTFEGFSNALIDVGSPIITQDLKSSGPSDTNFASSLAGAIPRESRQNDVNQEQSISSARFTDLEQLGVFPRALTDEERVAGLIGWSTYDDYPESASPSEADFRTVVNRLPGERAAAVLALHQSIFYTTTTDPQTGEARPQSRAPEIKSEFEGSIRRFRGESSAGAGVDDRVDPVALRVFVERTPGEDRSLAHARDLQNLLKELELLGLTTRELRRCKSAVLRLVRPNGLPTREAFESFLKTDVGALEREAAQAAAAGNG